jgi:hypothetical protein
LSSLDVFYGLNVVRVLSIVGLLLAFSSSIVTMVSDVRAVNKFQQDIHPADGACGYVECACALGLLASCTGHADSVRLLLSEAAPFPISQQVSSGRSSIAFLSSSSSSSSSYPRSRGRCSSSTAFSRYSVRNSASAPLGSSRDCASPFSAFLAVRIAAELGCGSPF